MKNNSLKTLKKAPQSNKKVPEFAVLDIETWGFSPKPENLAFGVLYYNNRPHVFYSGKELDRLIKTVPRGTFIFGHNIEYDLLGTYGNIFQNVDNKAIAKALEVIEDKHVYANLLVSEK